MTATEPTTTFLWLEITGKCQLSCSHCYAGSGPDGTHGTMTADDWKRVITDGARTGVTMVQFIGGEPTLHPDLPELIRYALDEDLSVEVYSNLVHVTGGLWNMFRLPGVSLATSFYSDDREQHRRITGRDTLRQTTASIEQATAHGIPLRVGIIEILDGQRVTEATELLGRIGVQDVSTDRMRAIGRAGDGDATELCGQCGDGIAAILPDGSVSPCPMSRATTVGNVLTDGLSTTLGEPMRTAVAALPEPVGVDACNPPCNPNNCSPFCLPSQLCTPNCRPRNR